MKGETDNKDISQIIELVLKELGINQSDNIDIQALEYKLRVLSLNNPPDGNHFQVYITDYNFK